MLSGCHPFDGETVNDLFKRIENLEFKYPSHFSKEVRALLDKIIVVDPLKRATISDIQFDPWFRVNYHGTLDTMAQTTPSSTTPPIEPAKTTPENAPTQPTTETSSDPEKKEENTVEGMLHPNSAYGTPQIVVNKEDYDNAVQDVDDSNESEERQVIQDPNQQRKPRGRTGRQADPRNKIMSMSNGVERMSVRMQNMEQLNAFELIAVMMRGKLNPLVSKHFTRRANRFSTCGHPDDLYDRMIQFLHEKKFIVRPKDTEYEFKATMKNKLHEMNFAVQFFIVSFEMIIVEVIRLKGNILKFQEIFREMQSIFDYEAQKKVLMRPNPQAITVTSSNK